MYKLACVACVHRIEDAVGFKLDFEHVHKDVLESQDSLSGRSCILASAIAMHASMSECISPHVTVLETDLCGMQGRCHGDGRSVTIMVSDSCPECEPDHIDLQVLTYEQVVQLASLELLS